MVFGCVSVQYIFQTSEMYGIVMFRMEKYAVFRVVDMDWCVLSTSPVHPLSRGIRSYYWRSGKILFKAELATVRLTVAYRSSLI